LGIKWTKVWGLQKERFEKMGEAERFAFWLMLQYKTPYLWGRETPEGSDCSGAVCMALYAATGLLIRTTADDLYKRVFTVRGASGGIRAAFFITEDERKRDGALIKKGTAIHVAGLLDDGVVLNSAVPGARVRLLKDMDYWFQNDWCRLEVRGLDRAALERLSGAGVQHDLDKDFWEYFIDERGE
jgi:murein DD-endopeptidase